MVSAERNLLTSIDFTAMPKNTKSFMANLVKN